MSRNGRRGKRKAGLGLAQIRPQTPTSATIYKRGLDQGGRCAGCGGSPPNPSWGKGIAYGLINFFDFLISNFIWR